MLFLLSDCSINALTSHFMADECHIDSVRLHSASFKKVPMGEAIY